MHFMGIIEIILLLLSKLIKNSNELTNNKPNTEGNSPKPANKTPFYKFIEGPITFMKFPSGAN